ncbi:hypothetical protein BLNAU_12200 [Blattamonas nauphoetae]|uniref:Uncharacterized protein n=1 Tax=Blattamonas nauphoetae TaxID=2049346 RepID=A0ABQ9XMA1_9EUKA|nr:hypothetical protein BLNAU_19100 [Blattamonas nauphoetae]KAK2948293.1 hypothetical protein BLNAU_16742 [Blattamonas nauphoetae]KAK2952879.1 hypothetical protein BLNAU_12200 [Blattamonas nauphoetae]
MEAQRSDFRKGKTCFELESIFIIAPDEFVEVVFPEEFNIVVGAVQGNTGPKKPNLTTSVPSGGTAMLK